MYSCIGILIYYLHFVMSRVGKKSALLLVGVLKTLLKVWKTILFFGFWAIKISTFHVLAVFFCYDQFNPLVAEGGISCIFRRV